MKCWAEVFEVSADLGDAEALVSIAYLYGHGEGVEDRKSVV